MIPFVFILGALIAEPIDDCDNEVREWSLVSSWYDDCMLSSPHLDECLMNFVDSEDFSHFADKLISAAAQGDHTEEVLTNLLRVRSRTDGYYADVIKNVLEDLVFSNSHAIALYVSIDSVAGQLLKDDVAQYWCHDLPVFLEIYEPYVGSATALALVAEAKKRLADCENREGEL